MVLSSDKGGKIAILRVVVFKKSEKQKHFFKRRKNFVEKCVYTTSFGEIEIYTVHYFKKCEKAKKLFFKNFGCDFHSTNEKPNEEYLIKLSAKKIIDALKAKKAKSVFIDTNTDFSVIENICRYSKKLYLNQTLFNSYGAALFENCGVLPKVYKSGAVCDMVLNGKENCQAVLPKELLEICPSDFPATLFCSLIYTENGYFVG